MNRRYGRALFWIDVLGGLLVLNLAFILSVSLRFDDLSVENPTYFNYYLQLLIFFNLLWLLFRLWRRNDQSFSIKEGIRRKVGRNVSHILAHIMAFALLILALKGTFFSRLFGLYFYLLWFSFTLIWTYLFHHVQLRLVKRGVGRRRIALVGKGLVFNKALQEVESLQHYGLELVQVFGEDVPKGNWSSYPSLEIENRLEAKQVDELFIASEEADELLKWERLADRLAIRVRLLPNLRLPGERSFHLHYLGSIPVFYPRPEPLELAHNRWMKRSLDLLICLIVFLFIYPWTFPLLAIFVRLSGKGSIFFRQSRTGWRDETFEIIKFRSMDESGNSHAIGKFMRKYSLDELPQFINVFKGQMSVVGPRPHMLEHTSDYRKALDSFMLRHLIQPGLSGLAQVQGHRGSIEHDEDLKARVAADVYYMENWSLLLDLKIVGLTFIQLFSPSPRAR